MLIIGIEGTAHTFGIGVVEYREKTRKLKILSDVRDIYKPEKGGIHPSIAAEHHSKISAEILRKSLNEAKIEIKDCDYIAYSAGPGLPPCLKVTMEFAQKIAKENKKKLIMVNHPVAHLEVARALTECKDPVIVYVSGGNTQIIGYSNGRYRVFGETLDIAVGNAIDTLMRELQQPFPGGPIMEKLAETGCYIELPYVVKGMDLSFAGLVTAASKKFKEGNKIEDVCFSFQETAYAMITEVAERAMAHLGKKECVLTGGVAASKRLREMLAIMCEERDAKFEPCPKEYTGDNGVMIAITGVVQANAGDKGISTAKADFDSRWRADEVEVNWIEPLFQQKRLNRKAHFVRKYR